MIQSEKLFKNAELKLYDTMGKCVKHIRNISGKTIVFEREHLKDGLYFLILSEGNKTIDQEKIMLISN